MVQDRKHERVLRSFRPAVLCAVVLTAFPLPAAAEGGSFSIVGLAGTLRSLLTGVIVASALASLIFAVVHMTKGDRDAASKFWYLLIGCAIGIGLLMLIPVAEPKGLGKEGVEDFGSLKDIIRSYLVAGLSVISMITLTINAIKVMQGDPQAARKFFTWLMIAAFGIGFLGVV